ncbi:MAG: hypothetical protein FIA89_15325 [Geobacter sp.]|nr:hypothetical protein [Geobacter sp.]
MPIHVVKFLKELAEKEGFEIFDSLYGSIQIDQIPSILQSSGAVYGIWVEADVAPSRAVSELPGYRNWYPVYWGKDISPLSRMKAHVQGHRNGNINLPKITEIRGKRLIFGAILVARYVEFELLLHSQFPSLKGTPAIGKEAKVVRIEN